TGRGRSPNRWRTSFWTCFWAIWRGDGPMDGGAPVILLPGLLADDRLFQPQRAAIPGLIAARWVPPRPAETLNAYAARLAGLLDPGRPCYVGGVSFGGAVALEMAVHLKARACFLIG